MLQVSASDNSVHHSQLTRLLRKLYNQHLLLQVHAFDHTPVQTTMLRKADT